MPPSTARCNTGAPRCGASAFGVRFKPMLEIIPNTRFIVFYGSEHEASPVKLSGVVRFNACESMSISKPKIRLEGRRKITWYSNSNLNASEMTDKNTFFSEELKLGGVESTHKVKAGVIEWPFEFELSPSMPESVEGLSSGYIGYYLHANVCRSGWNNKDLVASEHIRIVRTLGPDSMDIPRSRINTDIWANKIAYTISTQSDVFVFGTSITADVELSPIRKGLTMGQVDIRLLEFVVKRLQLTDVPGSRERTKTEEKEVAREVIDFPEDSLVTYDDETVDNPTMSDEMYRFQVHLPLPSSLNQCRQDVDSHQLQITHRFKIMISLHNPEGHVSQLVCRLPVKLFISPNLPVDDSNEVCARPTGVSDQALNAHQTSTTAPPQYGYHILDQLFSDTNPSGYATRTPSIPISAPTGSVSSEGARSRSSSNADVDRHREGTSGTPRGQWTRELNEPSAEILESRLANLQTSEDEERRSESLSSTSSSSSNPSSSSSSNPSSSNPDSELASRRTSESNSTPPSSEPMSRCSSSEDGTSGIRRRDYNMHNLLRVPSYGHALRSADTVTPVCHVPPTYIEAMERSSTPSQPPPVPQRAPPERPVTPLQMPPQPQGPATPLQMPAELQQPAIPSIILPPVQRPATPPQMPTELQRPATPLEMPPQPQEPATPTELPPPPQAPATPSEMPPVPQRPPPERPAIPPKRPEAAYSGVPYRHSLDCGRMPSSGMSQTAYLYSLRRLSGAQSRAIPT